MAESRHLILLVEDDAEMASLIESKLRAAGHRCLSVTNQSEALAIVRDRNDLCCIVADRGILVSPEEEAPLVEAGDAFVRAARKAFPRVEDGKHLMWIIVMSGHKEFDDAIRRMRDGADDFIQKPLSLNKVEFIDHIATALSESGRRDHGRCEEITERARNRPDTSPLTFTITGNEQDGRWELLVRNERVLLMQKSFVILLKLIVARERGEQVWLHKIDLDDTEPKAEKALSRLRKDIDVLPKTIPVFDNNRRGSYRIHGDIAITPVDWQRLAAIPDPDIRNVVESRDKSRRK